MTTYLLRVPLPAVRYQHGGNDRDVAELVIGNRSGVSWSNIRGYLDIFNGGLELIVPSGSWVVIAGDDTLILSEERFHSLFTEAE